MGIRVLVLSDYLPPHVGGGVEKVVGELCRGLARRGHRVAALGLRTCPAPRTEVDQGVTIRRVPAVDLTGVVGLQLAVSVHVLPALVRTIRSFRPDVVHAHNLFFRTTEAAALARVFFRTPLVTTLHLAAMDTGPVAVKTLIGLYNSTFGRFIIRRSDQTIAVSQAVAEHARTVGRSTKPITVVPNGVDTQLFNPGDAQRNGRPTVLFVGRLVGNKGPQTLMEAVPGVLRSHPECLFVLAGAGPLRPALEDRARKMGVSGSVEFLGVRDDVPRLMRRSSVFVRPSSLEGMPLTVLEAMASGLPVVATPAGGTPELVEDGKGGYLFPIGDHGALARSITRLLDDRDSAVEMGRRGRRTVENGYTWDQAVERTEEVYRRAVSG